MVRRFLTRTLLVILIAFCAYNWYAVQHLRAEVDSLRGRSVSTDPGLDWKDASRRLAALQRQVIAVQHQAESLWRDTHAQSLSRIRGPRLNLRPPEERTLRTHQRFL